MRIQALSWLWSQARWKASTAFLRINLLFLASVKRFGRRIIPDRIMPSACLLLFDLISFLNITFSKSNSFLKVLFSGY